MGRMNPDVKERWVAALRSGDYPQGDTHLNSQGKFCCLGVLHDVTDGKWKRVGSAGTYGIPGVGTDRWTMMPPREWAEQFDLKWSDVGMLAGLNDGNVSLHSAATRPHTFAEIADIIEREL